MGEVVGSHVRSEQAPRGPDSCVGDEFRLLVRARSKVPTHPVESDEPAVVVQVTTPILSSPNAQEASAAGTVVGTRLRDGAEPVLPSKGARHGRRRAIVE